MKFYKILKKAYECTNCGNIYKKQQEAKECCR